MVQICTIAIVYISLMLYKGYMGWSIATYRMIKYLNVSYSHRASSRKPSGNRGSCFLLGTYRWAWLDKADQVGALFVALHLLRLAYMRRTERVQFGMTRTAGELGMVRSTLYRKLKELEGAGLVRVDRCRRRWPTVLLLESPRITRDRGAVSRPKNAKKWRDKTPRHEVEQLQFL